MQQVDLNISLTAVGLLWNIADFIHRDRDSIVRLWAESGLDRLPAGGKSQSEVDAAISRASGEGTYRLYTEFR